MRCWDPCDAPLVANAINTSLDHLRPWISWAHEAPFSAATCTAFLRRFRGQFDLGQDFAYGIFTAEESEVVGGAGLHTRAGEGALEIGYWIRASRAGQGFATEVTAALTRAAFAVCEVDRVDVIIDPANAPSLRVPRKLGYREEATLRRRLPRVTADGPRRDEVVFSLLADEFPDSPSAGAAIRAYDVCGNSLL
jgi:RimJ/RimL family protein N-acetyltransferase